MLSDPGREPFLVRGEESGYRPTPTYQLRAEGVDDFPIYSQFSNPNREFFDVVNQAFAGNDATPMLGFHPWDLGGLIFKLYVRHALRLCYQLSEAVRGWYVNAV